MVNKDNDKLINIVNEVASGNNISEASIEYDKDLLEALNIISKVKQSFVQSDKIFKQTDQVKEGDKWGHLFIIKKIGSGAMGMVYEAYDSILDRKIAVKFLNPTSSQYISSKHFIEEARRIAKVRHPNVMAIFGANTYKNITGFWSELLEGNNLSTYDIKQLNWNKIHHFAHDLTKAVRAIHNNEIIHGDIKPQNVIIDKGKRAVLMDFGSGSDLQRQDSLISTSTPIIMAPELFKGLPKSKASDTYSLGVVFYFLSSGGKYPYKAHSFNDLKQQIFMQKPIDYACIKGPKSWINLIKNMLCLDPNDSPSIDHIHSELKRIKQAPKRRNKKIFISTIVFALLSTISILLYSNKSLENANKETNQALTETKEINDLMTDLLASVNPIAKGKDVLMVDVIHQLIIDTKNSNKISNKVKAKTLLSLAKSLNGLDYKTEASDLFDYILSIKNLSPNQKSHIYIAQSKLVLSENYNQKTVKHAMLLLDKVKEKYPNIIKQESGLKAAYTVQLADIFHAQGKDKKAIKLTNSALNYWLNQSSTTVKNSNLGYIYGQLSWFTISLSQFNRALKYGNKALQYYEKVNPNLNANIFSARNNVAVANRNLGNYLEAIKVLKIQKKNIAIFMGKDSEFYIVTLVNLASNYYDAKLYQDDLAILNEVIPLIVKKYSKNTRHYLAAMNNYASVQQELNLHKDAENSYLEIISIAKKIFNEKNATLLMYQYNLAELYYKSQRPQKAIDLLTNRIIIANEILGEKQLITISMNEAIAWSHHLLKNDFIALPMMQKVVDLKTEILGVNHQLTRQSITYLKIIKDQFNESIKEN